MKKKTVQKFLQTPACKYGRIWNYLIPILLTAAVAIFTYYRQTFTLLRQEEIGLFLNTPDYYRTISMNPLPVSHIIGGFIVQFFGIHPLGTILFTTGISAAYLISLGIMKKIGAPLEVICTALACTVWWFTARASSPATGTAIILISALFLALMTLLKRGGTKKRVRIWDTAAAAVLIAATTIMLSRDRDIKEVEKWSKIEFAAVHRNWDYLLKYATPSESLKDVEVVPWALLAHNVKGELKDEFGRWPVTEEFGLDYGTNLSYRSALFGAVLYRELGVWNESIHQTFQSGSYLPHCTSFRTLRMLIEENYAAGDSLMVVKYCDVLEKSTLHKNYIKHYREHPCVHRDSDRFIENGSAPHIVFTKNQMDTMLQLGRAGIESPMAMERYFFYYQLRSGITDDEISERSEYHQ